MGQTVRRPIGTTGTLPAGDYRLAIATGRQNGSATVSMVFEGLAAGTATQEDLDLGPSSAIAAAADPAATRTTDQPYSFGFHAPDASQPTLLFGLLDAIREPAVPAVANACFYEGAPPTVPEAYSAACPTGFNTLVPSTGLGTRGATRWTDMTWPIASPEGVAYGMGFTGVSSDLVLGTSLAMITLP
jgi:hypothetical protein